MKIHYEQQIHIQKYLSENMSYKEIAKKKNISNSAVFYEIKTKLINNLYKAEYAEYPTKIKRYYVNHQRTKYHNIKLMTSITTINNMCRLSLQGRTANQVYSVHNRT